MHIEGSVIEGGAVEGSVAEGIVCDTCCCLTQTATQPPPIFGRNIAENIF